MKYPKLSWSLARLRFPSDSIVVYSLDGAGGSPIDPSLFKSRLKLVSVI